MVRTYSGSALLMMTPLRFLIRHLLLVAPALANPVEIPYRTDFSGDFEDFYAPTRGGYSWSHNWRTGKYQVWVSTNNRTVTASMQARELAGKDFILQTTIDPVEFNGTGHSIGLAAGANTRTFGTCYLADVKTDTSRFRILRISGGTTTVAAETDIGFSISGSQSFELTLTGDYSGGNIDLSLTVTRGGESATLRGSDSSPLRGSYFGLRGRCGSGNFEYHFDDYRLDRLNIGDPTPRPDRFAVVGEPYDHVGNGVQPEVIPPWASVFPSGGFFGTPSPADRGVYEIRYPGMDEPYVEAIDTVVVVLAPVEVLISEFMADNNNTLRDEEGDSSDWIELFNPTSSPVDLSAWSLTDSRFEPQKWTFPPGTILEPFAFRVVFASGKDLPGHAGFRLGADAGGYLGLNRPDGTVVSEYDAYPSQREDVSFGLFGDYSERGFLLEPTPGAPNPVTGYQGFTADTRFSVKRGFFDAPFTVEVTCETPGATIVTTTDGTVPTLENGQLSSSPASIAISQTSVLRAAAFAPNLAPTNVDTQTYLFLEDVKTQDSARARARGWPSGSINGQSFNYGMDPDIINGLGEGEFEEAMSDIPSLSFVTDLDNFNDPVTGFWVNAENRGRGWERPLSVELLDPEGGEGFQIDAGVRMRGGFSRQGSNPKHSFRLYFRSKYGDGKLNYPLFGLDGADEFDSLDLRTSQGGGGSWHFNASANATFNRDVFARESQRDQGQPHTRSQYYHLYLNGQYFGLFQSQERLDSDHAASYFGGGKEDYDVIKTRTKPHRVEALDGDPDAWGRLYDAAVAGFASDARYFAVQGLDSNGDPDPAGDNLVDIDNLIDYMMVIFFTGQSDGPVNAGANVPKNFYAMRPRDGSDGFRFFIHDNEDSLRGSGTNVTGDNGTGDRLTYFNPKWLHQQLDAHPLYRRRFGDRIHQHFFNDGALTPDRTRARFLDSANAIQKAVIGESARWGDTRRATPYDQDDWQAAVNNITNQYLPGRSGTVLSQLRGRNLYPDVTAPSFNQHGGRVPEGFALSIEAPEGTIYYTLDGSDPAGTGGMVWSEDSTLEPLLPRLSQDWRYLVTAVPFSDSEVVEGHPSYGPADWKHPSFADGGWSTGNAPLGYGGVGSPSWTTRIGDGGTIPRNRTTYLRKSFQVTGATNYTELEINIRRDDGAIVYLNGREIARSNMPEGSISYAESSVTGASGSGETNYFRESFTLTPGLLVEGENMLAVEVHQESDRSSDLVIDVELLGLNVSEGGVRINANTRVKSRALSGGEWSALNEAQFFVTEPASNENLVVSEIYYNPPGPDEETEYLELQNISETNSIHLDGLSFLDGIAFSFPPGVVIAPGERILIVNNLAAFEAAFGAGLPVVGEYQGNLSNGGEPLVLGDILSFSYGDRLPWSELADGDGRSLVFTGGDPNEAGAWRASASDGGSPGGSDATVFPGGDFRDYAFGESLPVIEGNNRFSFARNLEADDVTYVVESSSDLNSWQPASAWQVINEEVLDSPFVSVQLERIGREPREFLRVRAERTAP